MIRVAALIVAGGLAAALILAAIATWVIAKRIERRFPPVGAFLTVNGVPLHYVDEGPRDAPVILLIHGASSNLRDVIGPARAALGGRFRLIAADRPGHGWSQRGAGHDTPDGQAKLFGAFLDALGVTKAVVKGHSFGASVAAALAVERPDLVSGVLLSAPATHPWPSGRTNWYNHFARTPFLGWLFTRTLTLPAGLRQLGPATACVFAPNAMPGDYLDRTGIALVLTPRRFMDNSVDVTNLHAHVTAYAPRYREIIAPLIIITGDADGVVSPYIHAIPMSQAVAGARLFMIPNVGHKPDYALAELSAAALEHLAGFPQDLDGLAAKARGERAGDKAGKACPPPFKPAPA
jgi:pimeloyl-ACP methyl ester carboxylesterase